MKTITENLKNIQTRIDNAINKSEDKVQNVTLVAVSKHHSAEEVREAYQTGQRIFAENRVQELIPKIEATSDLQNIEWQLIGHLQKNKARQVVGKVALIQSVDSIELMDEIEKRATKEACQVNILAQVNVANEQQKHGISFEEIDDFIEHLEVCPHIVMKGFMFIAPNLENKNDLKPYFVKLYEKFMDLKSRENAQLIMQYLSMGMSGDFEFAIAEGANMIRVGSAIFNIN